jgi:hypothetical protein
MTGVKEWERRKTCGWGERGINTEFTESTEFTEKREGLNAEVVSYSDGG